jgi:type VI secretion system protein ImpG
MDRLAFYLSAPDDVAFRLHELLLASALGTWVSAAPTQAAAQWRDSAESLRALGFDDEHALLPESMRSFSGHRLLQEVAALPQRLAVLRGADLGARWARVKPTRLRSSSCSHAPTPHSKPWSTPKAWPCTARRRSTCFQKRLDRVVLGPDSWEFHAVPDRTKPMDFEVHSLHAVVGHGAGREPPRQFRAAVRNPRRRSNRTAVLLTQCGVSPGASPNGSSCKATRSAYLGDEVFISLVDASAWPLSREHPPARGHRLGDQPRPADPAAAGRPRQYRLEAGHARPGEWRRGAAWPEPADNTPPRWRPWLATGEPARVEPRHAQRRLGPGVAAASLRTTLGLYGPPEDASWTRQVGGVRSLKAQRVVRRLPYDGPLTFGTGVALTLELDDLAFQGMSAYLLASVLERFFSRHAAINSFTQMTLRTAQRGVVAVWPPRIGLREAV